MNEVELRLDKFIRLIELSGRKELVNIKKLTITKLKEELLFNNSPVLKSLKYTINQIEDRCGRLNIYRFNVVDVIERAAYCRSLNDNKKEFFKQFNEEMYEGYLYFVESTKSKKPLLLVYADKSSSNKAYNSEDINNDRFVVLM